MIQSLDKSFRGMVTVSGPTRSGKSKFAEYLLNEHDSVTYIATSKPRPNDFEWKVRIEAHKARRPVSWNLLEYPDDISKSINSFKNNESILIDSLGSIVEQYIELSNKQWIRFEHEFVNSLINYKYTIIVVIEETGWGVVPSTPIGHLYRERLCKLSSLLSKHSRSKWFVVQGTAIDLDKIDFLIP